MVPLQQMVIFQDHNLRIKVKQLGLDPKKRTQSLFSCSDLLHQHLFEHSIQQRPPQTIHSVVHLLSALSS